MADPRALLSAEGVGAEYISPKFDSTIVYDSTKSGGSASVGLAVTMVADKQVGLTQDGDVVVGKLIRVQSDGFCTVQIHGGMTLPAGNGATVTFNSTDRRCAAVRPVPRAISATSRPRPVRMCRPRPPKRKRRAASSSTQRQALRCLSIWTNFPGKEYSAMPVNDFAMNRNVVVEAEREGLTLSAFLERLDPTTEYPNTSGIWMLSSVSLPGWTFVPSQIRPRA
jgi:hypothetical protein